jgi:hypothetical protein
MAINSKDYWEWRFRSGDWEAACAREQTRSFAIAQTKRFPLDRTFNGTLLDFGCALGDAFPVYRRMYPHARLVGVDFSLEAIYQCRRVYSNIGSFHCASYFECPEAEVIVCSNVLEHIESDLEAASALLGKCQLLLIVAPFREQYLIKEHLRSYDRNHFDVLGCRKKRIFAARGWSQYGPGAYWWEIRIKNLMRPLFGKRRLRRRLQIIYELPGKCAP